MEKEAGLVWKVLRSKIRCVRGSTTGWACSLSVGLPGTPQISIPSYGNQANHICFGSPLETTKAKIQRVPHLGMITVIGFIASWLCSAWDLFHNSLLSPLHTKQGQSLALRTEMLDEFIQTQDFHSFSGFLPGLSAISVCVQSNHPPRVHLTEYNRKTQSIDPGQFAESHLLRPLTMIGHKAWE